jgi:hypothetical protein
MKPNPDQFVHAFQTFLGLPPDVTQFPVCGAILSPAYDRPGSERPRCPVCEQKFREQEARSVQ